MVRHSSIGLFVVALVVATLLASACRGDAAQSTATPRPETATPTSMIASPSPTRAFSVEDEVLRAYLRYWEVYAEALFTLDSNRLSQVMTGPRLERALDEIASLRAQGRAVRVVVKNEPVVVAVQGDEAGVVDQYENASYLIDAKTKEAIGGTGTPNVLRDTFTLVRSAGTWKVRDSIRQAPQ